MSVLSSWWEKRVLPGLIGCACGARPIAKQRAKIVPLADGVVADIGFGSGTNLPFLDAGKVREVIAIEPSRAMLDHGRGERRGDISVREIVCGAEAVDLPDACVDTVLMTFALCTIPDAPAALREAARILKPDGRMLFCEHGLAPDAGIARWQRRIEPVWRAIAGGCHLTRDTRGLLEANGWRCERVETMYLPGTPRFAGFNVWGEALPA